MTAAAGSLALGVDGRVHGGQALGWLRADLALWQKQADSGKAAAAPAGK